MKYAYRFISLAVIALCVSGCAHSSGGSAMGGSGSTPTHNVCMNYCAEKFYNEGKTSCKKFDAEVYGACDSYLFVN